MTDLDRCIALRPDFRLEAEQTGNFEVTTARWSAISDGAEHECVVVDQVGAPALSRAKNITTLLQACLASIEAGDHVSTRKPIDEAPVEPDDAA